MADLLSGGSRRVWQRRLVLTLLLAPALLWLFALIVLPHVQLALLSLDLRARRLDVLRPRSPVQQLEILG